MLSVTECSANGASKQSVGLLNGPVQIYCGSLIEVVRISGSYLGDIHLLRVYQSLNRGLNEFRSDLWSAGRQPHVLTYCTDSIAVLPSAAEQAVQDKLIERPFAERTGFG